jgi:hypothetical protein
MHVGAADRGGRDAHQRIERADLGDWLVIEHDAARLDENGGFHLFHGVATLSSGSRHVERSPTGRE